MSHIDEEPIFRFKRDYDPSKKRVMVSLEGLVQRNNQNTVQKNQIPLEDGISRGCCEGFASAKDNFMRIGTQLEREAAEFYENIGLFTARIINDAWARVRNNEFFAKCKSNP